MTLHTRVAVVGAIPVRRAFELALRAVCVAAGEPERYESALVDPVRERSDGTCDLSSTIGQGLAAWTWIRYRPDGPLYMQDHYEQYEGEEPWFDTPACALEINWDTAYGYTGPNGTGCADLHSLAIAHVHQELRRRGIDMHWYNEYDGQWHRGVENLGTLSAAGLEAGLWYEHTVKPALRMGFDE